MPDLLSLHYPQNTRKQKNWRDNKKYWLILLCFTVIVIYHNIKLYVFLFILCALDVNKFLIYKYRTSESLLRKH